MFDLDNVENSVSQLLPSDNVGAIATLTDPRSVTRLESCLNPTECLSYLVETDSAASIPLVTPYV